MTRIGRTLDQCKHHRPPLRFSGTIRRRDRLRTDGAQAIAAALDEQIDLQHQ